MVFQDLTGQKFGMSLVQSYAGKNKHGHSLWNCLCDCGTRFVSSSRVLKAPNPRSCGCVTIKHPFVEGESAANRKKRLDIVKANRWKAKSPKNRYEQHLKQKYGLSYEQYEQMFLSQGGLCAICRESETAKNKSGKPKKLSVDHDHATNKVRALLCDGCNKAIGAMKESTLRLLAAVAYLEKHKTL
jgi:hypothetical protein